MFDLAIVVPSVLNGVTTGAVYALIALGLTLIYGVLHIINFAHGEFLMVGMYVSYWIGFFLNVDPLFSWIASGIFLFIMGAVTYRLIIKNSLGKSAMAPLLATFGLSMVLKNFCMNRFTPNFRLLSGTLLEGKTVTVGNAILSTPQLVTALFDLVVLGVLYWVLKRTRLGWAIQATAMDSEAAELMGIRTENIYLLVFGIGGACVGITGGLMTSYLAVYPEVGSLFSLIAFVVVALGGFGSIPGALLAAILIGLVESFSGFYIAAVVKYVAVFAVYLAVILIRPKGLFGW